MVVPGHTHTDTRRETGTHAQSAVCWTAWSRHATIHLPHRRPLSFALLLISRMEHSRRPVRTGLASKRPSTSTSTSLCPNPNPSSNSSATASRGESSPSRAIQSIFELNFGAGFINHYFNHDHETNVLLVLMVVVVPLGSSLSLWLCFVSCEMCCRSVSILLPRPSPNAPTRTLLAMAMAMATETATATAMRIKD